MQGRVFAATNMLRQMLTPVGYLIGGVIADRWLEPAMMPGALLEPVFGPLLGVGPGAGMALMFLFTAIAGCGISLAGYLVRPIRLVEYQIPDAV